MKVAIKMGSVLTGGGIYTEIWNWGSGNETVWMSSFGIFGLEYYTVTWGSHLIMSILMAFTCDVKIYTNIYEYYVNLFLWTFSIGY